MAVPSKPDHPPDWSAQSSTVSTTEDALLELVVEPKVAQPKPLIEQAPSQSLVDMNEIEEAANELAAKIHQKIQEEQQFSLPRQSEDLDIDHFFAMVVAQSVSDVHLRVGHPPMLRRYGKIIKTNFPVLDGKAIMRFASWLVPEHLRKQVGQRHDADFARDVLGHRLRVNLLYEMGQLGFSIRVIPHNIPSLTSLGMPSIVKKLTEFSSGLVLITGKTGSGKSTTLASMLEEINLHHTKHVITIEDPVEYRFDGKKSVFTQRQIGIDTPSYPAGIKYSLRQDPDVLLIGEMRDRETATAAIKAAETGVLVFSTLHTSDAVQTINRILHFFEPHERDHIREQLAVVLRGCIAQKLYSKLKGHGRAAVAEVLLVTSTVKDYLLKNELEEIYALMEDGRFEGMQSMNFALMKLIQDQQMDAQEALKLTENPTVLMQRLKGIYTGVNLSEF